MSKAKKKKVSKPLDDGTGGFEMSEEYEMEQNLSYTWQDYAAQVWKSLAKHPYIDLNNKKVIANFYVSTSAQDINLHVLGITLKFSYQCLNLTLVIGILLCTANWIQTDIDERNFLDDEDFFIKLISVFQNVVGKYI